MANTRRWKGRAASQWLETRLIAVPRWHPSAERQPCTIHLATPAVDRCDRCGQPFCAACLQAVERWRICRACLARLERERAGTPLRERLRAFWPAALAALIVGVLLTGGMLAINRGTGSMAAGASLAGSAKKIGCLQAYPDRARLYVVGGLPLFGSPPEHLVLENCDFQPGEGALVAGGISGYDVHGQPFSEKLGPARGEVGDDGVLVVTVAIPTPTRFEGTYRITLQATGTAGSAAVAHLSAEGNIAQPTRATGG